MNSSVHSQDVTHKIFNNPTALRDALNSRGEPAKIVLVKGVYDLFHSGHYISFINAKKYGEKLIVAVNADSAVEARKGLGRPIIKCSERALLIAALSCVDWVVIYKEESPYKLIKALLPDIFAASHFNFLSAIEKEELSNYTNFVTVPKMGNNSTSSIIAKILEVYSNGKN